MKPQIFQKNIFRIWITQFAFLFVSNFSFAHSPDSIPTQSIVFVEGSDSAGNPITLGIGVIIKEGYIAVNYHKVASMSQVLVYKQNETKKYFSNGYLDVDEENDMVVISVPFLKGKPASIFQNDSVKVGSKVFFTLDPVSKIMAVEEGTLNARREIDSRLHFEIVSTIPGECSSGPVFYQGQLAGFVTCGYKDMKNFSYFLSSKRLVPLLNRSYIIKDYAFLQPGKKPGASLFQEKLMESLNAVIWMAFEDAIHLAKTKKKKILIDVYTNWCGWCKLMEKNAFGKKGIIGYVNENFYPVKLNAESKETYHWKGNELTFMQDLRSNLLAWSLLRGNMNYPSLVFLDERGDIITVVPGYMDARRLEVVLHFFKENAYAAPGASFQEFERKYWLRKAIENNE